MEDPNIVTGASVPEQSPTASEPKKKRAPRPPMGSEERKKYQRDGTAKSREKQKKRESKLSAEVDCQTEIDDDRKREIRQSDVGDS